jgi:hypothetical protein
MADVISSGNPKREILVDAIKELHAANLSLMHEKSVEVQFVKNHIKMALHLIQGLLNTIEAPEQTYKNAFYAGLNRGIYVASVIKGEPIGGEYLTYEEYIEKLKNK